MQWLLVPTSSRRGRVPLPAPSAHTQISRVQKMLADEYGTASNIKSRVNRLSVLSAITSAQQRLKLYTKVRPLPRAPSMRPIHAPHPCLPSRYYSWRRAPATALLMALAAGACASTC